MAEQQIRYCLTQDGARIGFATAGSGAPLVFVGSTYGSLEESWAGHENLLAELGRHRRVISYDHRGGGASLGGASDLNLAVGIGDLSTVVDHLGIERFDLWGVSESGAICAAYAAQNPDRVARLILWNSCPSGPAIARPGAVEGVIALIQSNWKLARAAISDMVFPTGPASEKQAVADFLESIGPDKTAQRVEFFWSLDVTDYLPRIVAPALVLHRRDNALIPLSAARSLASLIPDARLYVVDGDTSTPLFEYDRYLDVVWEFLGEGEPAAAPLPSGTAVILFADIADSTALTEQLGDAAFRERAHELDTSLRAIIRECSGTPVEGKLVGDGVLAVFTSARQAIGCALRCNAASEPLGLQLHLGIHAGDVIREGNNVYGGAVNIAARIAAASAPGEVLVSDTVRSLARTSAGVSFEDRGERELKGVADPQRLFVVRGGTDG